MTSVTVTVHQSSVVFGRDADGCLAAVRFLELWTFLSVGCGQRAGCVCELWVGVLVKGGRGGGGVSWALAKQ